MTLEERFEIFWKAYPRKVGKGACRKIWKRKKYDEETLEQMLETIKWQVNLKQWQNKEYIPHPSTWLNQERWEDEIDSELIVGSKGGTTKEQKDELMEMVAEKRRKMGIC
jgi:hypothetical protein